MEKTDKKRAEKTTWRQTLFECKEPRFVQALTLSYLSEVGEPVDSYLAKLTLQEKEYFANTILTSAENPLAAQALVQKSEEWKTKRKGCAMASNSATHVNHNPYENPLRLPISMSDTLLPNVHIRHGVKREPYARIIYEDRIRRILRTVCYARRDQWRWFLESSAASTTKVKNIDEKEEEEKAQGTRRPYFRFRKYWVALEWDTERKDWGYPTVEVLDNVGIFIDKRYPWKRGSPDGLVRINGHVLLMIEIKCSLYGVTLVMRPYYYDQMQSMVYLGRQYHPYIDCCDYVSYDHEDFTIQPIGFNSEYYENWFLPREMRWFFSVLFPFHFLHRLKPFVRRSRVKRQMDRYEDPPSWDEEFNRTSKKKHH